MDYDVLGSSNELFIDVLSKEHGAVDRIHPNYLSDISDGTEKHVLEYFIWADLGQELIFIPRHER